MNVNAPPVLDVAYLLDDRYVWCISLRVFDNNNNNN